MQPATRTSEGFPFRCNVCGKKMIVSAAEPLGDVTCPHCGVLCFPNVEGSIDPSDDEFKLAEKGMFVETNDEREIVQIYLRGRQYNDNWK